MTTNETTMTAADLAKVPSPCYVLEADKLRDNLRLIRRVQDCSGAKIILAFKAFSLWDAFPIIREQFDSATASSLCEARLAAEELGSPAYTYAPVYSPDEIDQILACSCHITFNSLAQLRRFEPNVGRAERRVSVGLRVNPELAQVETDLYNPCVPGSRLGILAADLPQELPAIVEGLHCHALCESSAEQTANLIGAFEARFAHWLPRLKWVNFGGGHLMTRKGYDVERLIAAIKAFRERHPNLQVILEPGSAFAWQTGFLLATVQDIVENAGVKTAMLNVSFACHMPDCLEMPYKPVIRGAHFDPVEGLPTYRMGGNSCLSGDYVGSWSFDKPLSVGDSIIFEDMIHYTTVKTTMFNGVTHPSIAIFDPRHGGLRMVRVFSYEDYRGRMG